MDFKDKLNIFNKINKVDDKNMDDYHIKKKNDDIVSKK
jgi:hypothetical protein